MYYDKWWKSQGRESEETACLSSKSSSQETVANALGVVNIGGIFVVLLCGLAFAVLVAIAEFCWKTSMKEEDIVKGRSSCGNDIMSVSTQLRTASMTHREEGSIRQLTKIPLTLTTPRK